MTQYPFAAIVGADDMALALLLTTVSPEVGGVLVRGEKGTAKSTMVRALTDVLPEQQVVAGCRFGCDPAAPDPTCPDGPHAEAATTTRAARLVELPVGATEDRVIGSLDLRKALGAGEASFEPGLLADANRGLLYVDEVNLLHDHLVDLLLDAAAMGRNTVERDGVSVSHAARVVLVGTMNPEEGELRPQLLDRFGLTVEIAASRDPQQRAEVVRRRLAFDANPETFAASHAAEQESLRERIAAAQALLPDVALSDWALTKIATVCAGFDVDGMRADIVTARAARANAAWEGRTDVTREDIRVAARLALPHRRRRNPFDAPGLDEDLLDDLLGDDDPDDDPPTDPDRPDDEPDRDDDQDEGGEEADGPPPNHDGGPQDQSPDTPQAPEQPAPPQPQAPQDHAPDAPEDAPESAPAAAGVAAAQSPFRTRKLTVRGLGQGEPGKRSHAITDFGRTIGSRRPRGDEHGHPHLVATITAAARRQAGEPRPERTRTDRLRITSSDLRTTIAQGRESNLVLFVVDASGSMAARKRMAEVKTAVLSLLLDAYQRRDRVGLITFRGSDAHRDLPPTSSVEAAAACLADLPHGGRTPLAEGLTEAARVLRLEHIRDPRRRSLLVLVTDGRATAGPDALTRAQHIAERWPGTDTVVVDCESGRFRLGLAADLAHRMGAEHVPLEQIAAGALVDVVRDARLNRRSAA
ncbi:VWA domain-containing protein [Janibacter sp. GXQ6167]|uniref:VWA domain-containing protein n=1 Tax=Janibacter sp. GXQ6167 TaxID=3240791 RepID=UPI00352447F3